ncbi:MAG TPA: leucyl aminopeptidase family protein [Bacteroidetes bacterium]|nr:leucyl aminopeptidase family protein [Bacteroidota bacterium]
MKFILSHSIKGYPDLLIVPIAQQKETRRWSTAIGSITHIPPKTLEADFKQELKEQFLVYFQNNQQAANRIVLLGLGKNPGFQQVQDAFRSFVHKRKSNLPASLGISFLSGNAPSDPSRLVEAAVNGMLLGQYDIGLYKTSLPTGSSGKVKKHRVEIFTEKKVAAKVAKAIRQGKEMASTQLQVFDLVNAPSNKKTPQTLAEWALQSGKKYGYDVEVLEKKRIEALGLHALLAVNKGSENPPTFIIMEYKPDGPALAKIGLVGKGVTFDTGGLSIKPSANMHYMKSDMGGAAAVMGTMEMVAKLQLPVHLMGVVPATDNSVDAKSIKPGDVISSYDGKTIEVIDTDAEGRLILADGLAYVAKKFKPDILLDLATLTGSCIRTLGSYAGGLFSNNDTLAKDLLTASQQSGEKLWQFPLWDEYEKEIKSDVADVKNYSGIPAAGAITAAKFLEAFIQDHPSWAHLDIAGVAVSNSEFSSHKSATAFGIRLLIQYLQNLLVRQKPAIEPH